MADFDKDIAITLLVLIECLVIGVLIYLVIKRNIRDKFKYIMGGIVSILSVSLVSAYLDTKNVGIMLGLFGLSISSMFWSIDLWAAAICFWMTIMAGIQAWGTGAQSNTSSVMMGAGGIILALVHVKQAYSDKNIEDVVSE